MAARVVELQKAAAAYIAGQTYSSTFNVHEKHIPKSDLADTATTNVFVYPQYEQGKQLPVDTRDKFGKQYTLLVHVVNFVDDVDSDSEIDEALNIAEQIEASLENVEQAGFAMLGFAAEQSANFLETGSLNERNTFNVVIPVIYITVD